jgi:arsenate reductase
MITIYHNGECSKSRGALEILQEENIPHEVRWYLTDPLSKEELKDLLKKLSIPASALARQTEPYYQEHFLGKELSEDEWLSVFTAHPELIERPIVENGNKALIARPPERLYDIR